MSFNEQILDAAKSVASATSALVKSATAAQRELVAQGKLSSNPKSEDGQWSEEMVSAVSSGFNLSLPSSLEPPHTSSLFHFRSYSPSPLSFSVQAKLVASATSNLCETVNSVVTGEAQEEKLIAAVKAVACFTVQLLVACQVKADINSESNRRLQVKFTYILALTNLQCSWRFESSCSACLTFDFELAAVTLNLVSMRMNAKKKNNFTRLRAYLLMYNISIASC